MSRLVVDHSDLPPLLSDPPKELAWEPVQVQCGPGDEDHLAKTCERLGIPITDHLEGQLSELATARFPGADRSRDRDAFLADAASTGSSPYHGSWMYFHWLRRMVRVLDEDDFFYVITNRNRNKITLDEQVALRDKSIGVIGLSVGGEIAVTLAQEHLCGRIKVADFDELELSNLNRISSGVGDLGVNKAWLVARRIAEINPWLDVQVFDEGVSEENADEFLDGLDLLVDECDGLALKFRMREMARDRRLNLLYAADERGMMSIEPYAYAEMELFHGKVTAPHGPRSDHESDLAYFKALSEWLGGWDRLSARSRDSLQRIGSELAGYPQLAGEPRFAAGQVASAARRILLGEKLQPFFGYQELEELFT